MSIFGSLLKTVIDTATLPIDVVKDVATLGGVCTDRNETYTGAKLKRIADDIEDVSDDAGRL